MLTDQYILLHVVGWPSSNYLWGGGHNRSQVCPVASLGVGAIASVLWRRHFHCFSELEIFVSELSLFLLLPIKQVHFHCFNIF